MGIFVAVNSIGRAVGPLICKLLLLYVADTVYSAHALMNVQIKLLV